MEEIRRAMDSPRRKSRPVDVTGVDHFIEIYLRSWDLVAQWKGEGRIIKYHDLEFGAHLLHQDGRHLLSPERRHAISASKKAAQEVVRKQTKLLENKDLPAKLRASIERLCTDARRYARRDKFWEEDVPKEPENYLAASAAEAVLGRLQPDGRQYTAPIKATAWKGKRQSTHRPETYSPLVRIAAVLRHFNEPVNAELFPQRCAGMVKACEKLLELRKRERP
jgi:hypothetical protein